MVRLLTSESVTTSGGHFGREIHEEGTFTWEKLDTSIVNKLIERV